MVDFTTYNANANLFCVVKLAFEFPPTGGLQLSSTFRTVKLLRYVGREDFWVFSFEILFCCFVLYYGVEEVMEIKKAKLAMSLPKKWQPTFAEEDADGD